jgi:hypothetical protein
MELVAGMKISRILFSAFILNGLGALIGLVKMGVVAHAVDFSELSSYFIYLAIWGWFATNGESVRQSMRQRNIATSWSLGFQSIATEWKLLSLFSVITYLVSLTDFFGKRLNSTDLFITLICGWFFVFTSTYTGLLESNGRIETSNWASLSVSIFTLPVFFLMARTLNFSQILFSYFCLNLMNGLVHSMILLKISPKHSNKEFTKKNDKELFVYKKIVLLESLPRVTVPLMLAHISLDNQLTVYSVLSRIFLIYAIYAVSINPMVSLNGRYFSTVTVEKMLRIIGPVVFLVSTTFIFIFSDSLVRLVGATSVQVDNNELLAFTFLGAVSIITQPFISSFSSGVSLAARLKSVLISTCASFIFIPFLVTYWGCKGGFLSLAVHQSLYFLILKLYVPRKFSKFSN